MAKASGNSTQTTEKAKLSVIFSKNPLQNLSFYMWCFFACSVVGWIYETVWRAFKYGEFINSGFCYGFYLPIYGFGGLILIFALSWLYNKKIKIGKVSIKPIIMFILILLIVSAVEFIASVALELIFDKRWWDYSKSDLIHIDGRVSLRNSSILASLGFIFVYIVHPLLNKLCRKIPPIALEISALLMLTTILTDSIITLITKHNVVI